MKAPRVFALFAALALLLGATWWLLREDERASQGGFAIVSPARAPADADVPLRVPFDSSRKAPTRLDDSANEHSTTGVSASEAGTPPLAPTVVHALAIVVRDPDGAPVAGAIAIADDRTGLRSEPTDAAGRASLDGVLQGTASMTVWAYRFFAQRVSLPPEAFVPADGAARPSGAAAKQPLIVVLERCPSLELHVVLADGTPAPGVTAELAGERDLFASALSASSPTFAPATMLEDVGTSLMRGKMSDPKTIDGQPRMTGAAGFQPDGEGRVSISDLLPGVPFTLSVWGDDGTLAWGPEELMLGPGELRELEVVVAHAPADLVVSVRDVYGAPVEGATVSASHGSHAHGLNPSTDSEGRATLAHLYMDRVTLDIGKQGFARQSIPDVAVVRGGPPFDVVLAPELQVRLFIHDERGRAVPADRVNAEQDGQLVANAKDAPLDTLLASGHDAPVSDHAHWLFRSLSPGDVVIVAYVGGRAFRLPHATTSPEADLVVPATGAVRVRWSVPTDAPDTHYILRTRALGEDPEIGLTQWLSAQECKARETFVPALIPGEVEIVVGRFLDGGMFCTRPAVVTITAGATSELTLVAP